MRKISMLLSPLPVALFLAMAAAPATAAGNAEQGPQNANSICSYSGLNDDPTQAYPEGGRTQNFGQLVRQGAIDATDKSNMERPGVLCNAHNLPWQDVTGSH